MAQNKGHFVLAAASNHLLRGALSNDLVIATGNSNQSIVFGSSNGSNMYVKISSNGFVGIGRSNPGYNFDVLGNINFTGSLTSNGVPFVSGGGFSNNGSNLFVTAPSNVGIHVSAPAASLHVGSNMRVDGSMTFFNPIQFGGLDITPGSTLTNASQLVLATSNIQGYSNNAWAGSNGTQFSIMSNTANDSWRWLSGVASNEVMRLTGSGRLGIGVAAPACALDVNGAVNAAGYCNLMSNTYLSGSTSNVPTCLSVSNLYAIVSNNSNQAYGTMSTYTGSNLVSKPTYFSSNIVMSSASNSYPSAALTANGNNALADGVYNVVASSEFNGSLQAYLAFDRVAGNHHVGNYGWVSADGNYSGTYSGTTTTTVSGVSQAGEYLQLRLPAPVFLYSFTLYAILTGGQGIPRQWVLAGSVDGTTWSTVHSQETDYIISDNATIVTSSPAAYSYFRFIVKKSTFAWTGIDQMYLNTSYTPSISIGAARFGVNSGGDAIVSMASNNGVLFFTSNAERVRVTSNGLVGVGTAAPGEKLEIYDTSGNAVFLKVNGSGAYAQAGLKLVAGFGAGNAATRIDFLNNVASTTVPRWTIINDYAQTGLNTLDFVNTSVTNSGRTMTLTQGGNVGIGATNPAYGVLQVGNISSGSFTNWLNWWTSANIGTSGHIATIATTDSSAARPQTVGLCLTNESTANNVWSPCLSFGKRSPTSAYINESVMLSTYYYQTTNADWMGGDLCIFTRSNAGDVLERMRVCGNGNVGVGTVSPAVPLHVKGATAAYGILVEGVEASDANSKTILNSVGVRTNIMPQNFGQTLYFYWKDGNGSLWRFTTTGASYFTGQHVSVPEDASIKQNISDYVGLIVCSADTGYTSYNPITGEKKTSKEAITITESLPNVALSSRAKDPAVFGVVADRKDSVCYNTDGTIETDGSAEWASDLKDRIRINSLGEGALWVTDLNGNISNGDYITSSDVPGHGQRQDDDLLHNYTVAKATMSCTFELDSHRYVCEECTTPSGAAYRRAFIGCTYHCG